MADRFQEGLESGLFQTVARISQPKNPDLSNEVSIASSWKGKISSILIPNNASAKMGVSSLILAERLKSEGHGIILTLSCRDTNRIGLGSIALGAAAIGIDTLLCVSGDHTTAGDHQAAKPVYDLDSVQMLSMLEDMQNGKDCGGNPLDQSPSFFKGAAVSATATPLGPQLMKVKKKIAAGAGFLITLPVFTQEQIAPFFEAADELTIPILVGVLLPSYQDIAEYQAGAIPGTPIPVDLVNTWKKLDEDAFRSASVEHARDLITKLRDSGKFAGISISASNREADIQELLA